MLRKKSLDKIAEIAVERLKEKGVAEIRIRNIKHYLYSRKPVAVGLELRYGNLIIVEVFRKRKQLFYRKPPGAEPFFPRDVCWPVLDAYFEEEGISYEESLR
jgi:acid phosphatase class B